MEAIKDEVVPQRGSSTSNYILWWACRLALLAAVAACVGGFVTTFNFNDKHLAVDGLWLGALIAWALLIRSFNDGPFIGLRPRWPDFRPLVIVLPLFAACWLPFYDNWRWAYTGDSFSVYGVGFYLANNGLRMNPLSVHGIDNAFTYLWELTYNWPMYFLGPELIWHRVGQLIIACGALAAIYAYFRTVVGNLWATVIVVATAMNYVWLWVTYVSYLKIDSNIFYFVTLIWVTLAWRHPQRLGLWMLAGMTAGLSLFYTPSAWAGIGAAGLVLAFFGLWKRHFGGIVVAGLSVLIVAVPILIELEHMNRVIQMQSIPVGPDRQQFFPGFDYVWKIFREILLTPYDSYIDKLGVSGPFFQAPLGHAYLIGMAIAFLSMAPLLRRKLRVPAVVPALLLLFVFDALSMALSNKGYGNVSHKRSYNLIPLQMFFAILPFYLVYTWGETRRWWRAGVVGATAVVLLVYGALNVRAMMNPHQGMYGVNLFDGLIQLRQTHPDQKIFLFTSRQGLKEALSKDGLFQFAYGLMDNVTMTDRFDDAEVERACQADAMLCYEPNFDMQSFDPLVTARGERLQKFEIVNSQELRCFECVPSGAYRSATGSTHSQ
jgi:hypothetical protein